MVKYVYSIKNGLKYPYSYQYSEFQGLRFLRAYIGSRNSVILKIKKRLSENTKYKIFFNLLNTKIKSYKSNKSRLNRTGVTKTSDAMLSILTKLNKKRKLSQKEITLLHIFLKKYEIKKKIFAEYDSNFRELGSNYKSLNNYILLSISLLLYFKMSKNLKFLNTALKLNDMLCSLNEKVKSQPDLIMLLTALNEELNIVRSLYRSKSIKL